MDWTPLLQAADVDLARFTPATPQGAPPVYADTRAAWTGTFIDAPDEHVRIEAAAYQGRPVYFAVIGEWKEELLSEQRAVILSAGRSNLLVQTAVIAALLVTGSWMALKNYRSGRGDRQGATRMALAFFLLGLIVWLFRAHHVADVVYEFLLFQRGMGQVLYVVGLVWVFYMAMEPYVRRVWPETVISWSRMLSGKWLDPLVGRDVLSGAAIGAISSVLAALEYEVPRRMGWSVPLPGFVSTTWTLNATRSLGSLFSSGIIALYVGLLLLLFLVLARMLTRRRWAAGLAFVLVFMAATARYGVEGPGHLTIDNLASWVVQGLMALLLLAVLTRYGLVGAIFCLLVRNLLMDFPVTWDFSVWYSSTSFAAIAAVGIILAAGFYAAVGGRSPMTAPRD